jgi:hypothetical protein
MIAPANENSSFTELLTRHREGRTHPYSDNAAPVPTGKCILCLSPFPCDAYKAVELAKAEHAQSEKLAEFAESLIERLQQVGEMVSPFSSAYTPLEVNHFRAELKTLLSVPQDTLSE